MPLASITCMIRTLHYNFQWEKEPGMKGCEIIDARTPVCTASRGACPYPGGKRVEPFPPERRQSTDFANPHRIFDVGAKASK